MMTGECLIINNSLTLARLKTELEYVGKVYVKKDEKLKWLHYLGLQTKLHLLVIWWLDLYSDTVYNENVLVVAPVLNCIKAIFKHKWIIFNYKAI